jgi:hypothetical protein
MGSAEVRQDPHALHVVRPDLAEMSLRYGREEPGYVDHRERRCRLAERLGRRRPPGPEHDDRVVPGHPGQLEDRRGRLVGVRPSGLRVHAAIMAPRRDR